MTVAARRDDHKTLLIALALSLLVHALAALLTQVELSLDFLPEPERSMEVELVPDPPKPPPPHKAEPEPPPPPQPPQPQTRPRDPVPVPQLRPGKLAETSSAPKEPAARPGISLEKSNARPPQAAGELSQTAQDMVLAQVLRMWRYDPEVFRGTDFSLQLSILVNRDGTLTDALHKDAPWSPGTVIIGYDRLPDGHVRRALESIMLALKLSQPLKLPPDDGKGWPRRMVIRFRPGDL